MRMSELAQRAKIPIGSLYQYFPDKAAVVASLAARINEEGLTCVREELTAVRSTSDLREALERIVDSFYGMYAERPAMRAVWQATQASPALQALDAEDAAEHTKLLVATMHRLFPNANRRQISMMSALLMSQLAASVRFAITLEDDDARATLALFKSLMLPNCFEELV